MKNIKMILLDVDGTLTDGKINISKGGEIYKSFNVKDGLILSKLHEIGIKPVIITGRKSEITEIRASELNIIDIYQSVNDKEMVLSNILLQNNIKSEEALYIGDDLNDIKCMKICGMKACPADSSDYVISISDYVSRYNGGDGAVRDCIEYFLKKTNQWNLILDMF